MPQQISRFLVGLRSISMDAQVDKRLFDFASTIELTTKVAYKRVDSSPKTNYSDQITIMLWLGHSHTDPVDHAPTHLLNI